MVLSKERGLYFQEKWEEMEYRFANIEMKKEIERLNKENKILRKNAEHNDKVVDKVNWENKRLNNIINEMEKEIDRLLERQYESERFAKEQGFDTYLPAKENLLCVKNKLQELKGSVSNE